MGHYFRAKSAREDHSCPPSSFVPPKRAAGAGVRVGMFRGEGIPLNENIKFESCKEYNLQSFKASNFQKCQSLKDSKI